MLHTVEFGNHKTGHFFLQILKSGYVKWMLINKGGYDATIWAAGPRHPLVQVTPLPGGKVARGLMENGRCRLCGEFNETIEHLVAGCKTIANSEYLARHNRALMVLVIAWAKGYGLVGKETRWYMENWVRGQVLENSQSCQVSLAF